MTYNVLNILTEAYERIGKLGEGFNGTADLWRNKETKELIIVKVTKSDSSEIQSRQWDYSLPREICSLVVAGSNAYITEPLDYDVSQDGYRIALRYYEGGSLDDLRKLYVKRGEQIPEEMIWHIFCQILNGLAHLHTKDIYHADIWQKNVLLGAPRSEGLYPDVVIADFGASESLDVAKSLKSNQGKSEAKFRSEWTAAKDRDIQNVVQLMHFLLTGSDWLTQDEVVDGMWWPAGHGAGNPAYSTELRRMLRRAQERSWDNLNLLTAESLAHEVQFHKQVLSERASRGDLPNVHLPPSRAQEMVRLYDAGWPVDSDSDSDRTCVDGE